MFVLLIRLLMFILVLIAIYVSISFFQRRDERSRLEHEANKQELQDAARADYVSNNLTAFENRSRAKRILFVFILPIFIASLLLWLAMKT